MQGGENLLPYLTEVKNPSKKYSVLFRGINYGEGSQDGEFAETLNLSTDQYPCITQRAERLKVDEYTKPTTLHSKAKILVIDETFDEEGNPTGKANVYYGDNCIGEVTAGKKQTATVGNYIVIFPDKKYYKVPTEDDTDGEFGNMEHTTTVRNVKFGTNKIYWTGTWDHGLSKGDSVTISNCDIAENNKAEEVIIRDVADNEITFDANTFTEGEQKTNFMEIKRSVPALDFVCESNYRLWGTMGNTIYASAYGKPLNFKSFEGLAGDSYYIDVASEGAFTGCIPFATHICFFKENTLHKLYGTKPSNFQINTSNVYGVQSGSERSMQIINEQLIYKGVGGVYSYTGGVPELISEAFGTQRYSDAVACTDGEKYYLSMRQGNKWNMFVYDVVKNIWLREDDTHAVDMTFHDGKVYFLEEEGGLYMIDKTSDRGDVDWSATFCTIHETINERKVYSKFHLRMDMSAGAWLAVDIKTDNDTQWRQIYTTHNEKAKTVSIPIIPSRCDSIDIRLRGKGKCTVKTFIREFTTGSDV